MIALVLILAGLGAYIYFVDSKRPATAVEEKAKVFTVEADKVEEVTITSETETSTLRKVDGTWRMTAPVQADADQSAVSSLTNALSTVEVNRVVEENASNLTDYGLATPRITVAYKAAGGNEGQLLIGDKTPTQSDVYAMKPGEKRVFLVSGFNESTFAKKPFDLRDKRILNFERDKIDSVEVARDANTVLLARSGSDWVLKQPIQARGDYSAIEALITKLASGSMTRLVEGAGSAPKDAAGLTTYGLNKPVARISLGTGSSRATLALGKAEEGAVYAQDQGRGLIFTVDPTFLSDLKSSADDYRDKEMFESRGFNTDQVRVLRGSETLEFRKQAGTGENPSEKWQRVVDGKPTDIDTTKMEAFLSKLTTLRAQSFVTASPSTGLATPRLVVSSSYDNGKFERVRIAKNAEVFGARDGEPGVAKLDAAAYDEAIKALDAVLAPPLPAPAPSPSPSSTPTPTPTPTPSPKP
jgi:Domain of unknown function (DUF4340)